MRSWRGIENTPGDWGRSAVTIGVFDGVHRGHQAVIKQVVALAHARGLRSVVVTFDPHPSEVVRPGSHPAILTSQQRKAELLAELGVDGLCVVPFTAALSRQGPLEFVHETLVSRLHAALVVVGRNFRFGHKAAGDVALLEQAGERFGFSVVGHRLEHKDEAASGQGHYSSTYIRSCIDAGDVACAAQALGRWHRIEGVVVRGDARGRGIGFPTANVATAQYVAVPADGIYAGWLLRDAKPLPAAISVGSNPTFAGTQRRVEAYILDFDDDLYGERVALDFVARIRDMAHFDGIPALVAAIEQDVTATRQLLNDPDAQTGGRS